ncbi:MAG: tRNA (guanosine(37)-N1)-methyltransferase TrmD [Eubacteriales bacterium]|nr:tRNA (guanosine(37)-N1)-methyltransferase TrmD [Eubacteriales bacterium]MDD3198923.1 tRNA (guanosine(37)-N1)-methyltransferase TrmD [Eubacteriales bacterium]MDD4122315.1 tRNA (guanosine(37)-N1)-methyltransferase TrmD [Eubacteriales bacterium]MDD4629590.1 tRNA (guanosine(37)-N1)-methyltransferase TrmD [Eubacteriales bacterium]
MRIDVLTLFPDMFKPVTEESILGRAQENGILDIKLTDIRDYSRDKHKKADDYPFGGGAGMVMLAGPVFCALNEIQAKGKRILYMSPRGKILDKELILDLSSEESLVIMCGHYEGIDQRIIDYWNMEEVSIGDYILTGGELPAMILIDAVARMIPEVLGSSNAHNEESIYSGLLEYPQYTKPRQYEGMEVPEVLISGNHKLIHLWQFEKALELTKKRRPDLFEKFLKQEKNLTKDEKKILQKILQPDGCSCNDGGLPL